MKKTTKGIISMILAFTMIFAISVTAFAASGFHKVNGTGSETGESDTYYSTTRVKCSKITAQGTSDNNRKQVIIKVQTGGPSGKVIASGVVTLNGVEKTLVNFYTASIDAGTYYVTVTSSDNVPYEVSTYFYE